MSQTNDAPAPKKRGPKPGSRNNPNGPNDGTKPMRPHKVTIRASDATKKALRRYRGSEADAVEHAVAIAEMAGWPNVEKEGGL